MPNLVINTNSAAYRNASGKLDDVIAAMAPILHQYLNLDVEARAAWDARDPFMSKLVAFCNAVASENVKDYLP